MLSRRSPFALFALAIIAIPSVSFGQDNARPVKTITFDAPSIGRKTAYNIFLPEGYEKSGDKRYPVLYLLHGFSGNYIGWARLGAGRATRGLDLIVVMPDAGNSWYLNWSKSEDGQKNAWEDFIIKDLIGHVDTNYRTIAKREGRAINGLSMGGYGGLTLGLRHPDLFCSIGSHSGALAFARGAATRLRDGSAPPARRAASENANSQIQIDGFRSQAERTPKGTLFTKAEEADAVDPFKLILTVPKEKLPHIYVDCGTEDRLIGASRELAKLMTEHKIAYTYGESAGEHNGAYWTREIGTSVAVQYAVITRSLAAAKSSDTSGSVKP